jgi:hypothetical protein
MRIRVASELLTSCPSGGGWQEESLVRLAGQAHAKVSSEEQFKAKEQTWKTVETIDSRFVASESAG